ASKLLDLHEVRFLVDAYYQMQDDRKRSTARERQMGNEPHIVISWLAEQSATLERQLKIVLDLFTDTNPVSIWAKSICGIGPVISAGLLANIDITRCPTVGHIWSFAGLIPGIKWEKGQKRPYNADFKTLCAFKIGESFVKVQNLESDIYGKIYAAQKKKYAERNDAGDYAERAKEIISTKRFDKGTIAYKNYAEGKLPPAHIHAMARRYAAKLFLAHYHEVAYEHHFGTKPPLPYPIAIMGHAHMIPVPGK
ncbi:MAG TPA: transposase, partial [Methylomicrobium sp.]|nr:transposase [Methylomicrobium sp.]